MQRLPRDAWADIDRRLAEALELGEAERASYVDELRERDAQAAAVLQSLLDAASRSDPRLEPGRWLNTPIWDELTRDASERPGLEGQRVGAYRIVHELDRGGMSVVYLAERADGLFDQQVALKFIALAAATEAGVRRFEQERQILAALNHPHIARLIDGGNDQRGGPYIVMEYVRGRPIDEFCASLGANLDRKLELFDVVAAAVEYAHRHLVVHRDLKPANILVTDSGDVKLLDFGIAKLLEPGVTGDPVAPATQSMVRLLTPEYASPEQVRGERVSTASDIFQLGTVLYELLTGRRPFGPDHSTLSQLEQAICEQEAARPSAIAARDGRHALARALRGDLDNIVLKALEKQPDRRYLAVGELRDDLRRFRLGLTVRARTPTLRYRTAKFIRRHRMGVTVALSLLVLLAGYAGTVTVQARRIAAEAARTERVRDFLASLFALANPGVSKGHEASIVEVVDAGARRVAVELGDQPDIQAELMTELGRIYVTLGRYDAAAEQLTAALSIRRRVLGPVHEDVARTTRLLGEALHYDGRYSEAEVRLREAVQIRRQLVRAEDLQLARMLKELGDLLHSRGELLEADAVLRHTLAIQIALDGEGSDDVAVTRRDLGNVSRDRGAANEAEQFYRRALTVLLQKFGADDPVVARTRSELALLLAETGRHDEAESLLEENFAVYAKLYPRGHAMEGTTFRNLGVLRLRQNRLAEARTAFEQALANYDRTLKPENPLVPRVQRYLAETVLAMGDAEGAALLAMEALERLRVAGLPRHPAVADALDVLGRARLSQQRATEAADLLNQSLEIRRQTSVASDPRLEVTLRHLARARNVSPLPPS